MHWVVHKFGGYSLANADCFQNVFCLYQKLKIELKGGEDIALVLSAMQGVTDMLLKSLEQSKERNQEFQKTLDQLQSKHFEAADKLLPTASILKEFQDSLKADFKDISDILRSVWLGKSYSSMNWDLVTGFGELWSNLLMRLYFKEKSEEAHLMNARDVLFIDSAPTGPLVDWKLSQERI